jgi:hypothetical protein
VVLQSVGIFWCGEEILMLANSMCDGDSAQGGTNALKYLARMSIKSLRFSVTGSDAYIPKL